MTYDTPDAPTVTEYIEQLPKKAVGAMRVWLSLSEQEQNELKKAIEMFDSLSDQGRQKLHEIIIMVHTGPWGPSCPYCGRS